MIEQQKYSSLPWTLGIWTIRDVGGNCILSLGSEANELAPEDAARLLAFTITACNSYYQDKENISKLEGKLDEQKELAIGLNIQSNNLTDACMEKDKFIKELLKACKLALPFLPKNKNTTSMKDIINSATRNTIVSIIAKAEEGNT